VSIPPRSAIRTADKWDLESIFAKPADWENAVTQLDDQLASLATYQGRLSAGASVLADWFEASERALHLLGRIYCYASNQYAADTTNQDAGALDSRAMSVAARAQAALAFAQPEMLAIGFDTLRAWVQSEPRLAIYAHHMEGLERMQPHVRSSEVEELLGQCSDAFASAATTHSILAEADLTFSPARSAQTPHEVLPVAQGSIDGLLVHPDREVRRTAWEGYADAHLAVRNTMANCLQTGVKQHVFMARAHRHNTALEASLAANFVPTHIYADVIESFRRNLPIWHRYWHIRREALGYEHLFEYDIKAPLLSSPPAIPYVRALDIICAGLAPLGSAYVERMRRGVTDLRWVDWQPNQGKRAGAFSSGVPGTHPFILLSYADDIYSLSTLAHELGHSMHSLTTWEHQPYVYADYSIFCAEVASNLHQALVRDHMLETEPSPEMQLAVVEEALSNFHRYFFLMPTLARFELEIHTRVENGQALTADGMSGLLSDLFAEAYGDEVDLDRARNGITWAQFHTHLYYAYYVYQYTTGIAAAQALAEPIRQGDAQALERYQTFLAAGSSQFPLDLLKAAGVDLSTPEPIDTAFAYLSTLVDRFEALTASATH